MEEIIKCEMIFYKKLEILKTKVEIQNKNNSIHNSKNNLSMKDIIKYENVFYELLNNVKTQLRENEVLH